MSDKQYVQIIIAKICKDSKRDDIKVFQKYLCTLIFHQWDLFVDTYKVFENSQKYKDIEHFLSILFEIDYECVKKIIQQLGIYKNYNPNELDARNTCCNTKLVL